MDVSYANNHGDSSSTKTKKSISTVTPKHVMLNRGRDPLYSYIRDYGFSLTLRSIFS